jgi:tetratricopeptide (TPR) repeat protein
VKKPVTILALLFSLLLIVSIFGCGGSEEGTSAPPEGGTVTEGAGGSSTPGEEPAPVTAIDWQRKGVDLTLAGKKDEALDAFNKSIELDPTLGYAYYGRAELYKLQFSDPAKAKADYLKACEYGVDVACKEADKIK